MQFSRLRIMNHVFFNRVFQNVSSPSSMLPKREDFQNAENQRVIKLQIGVCLYFSTYNTFLSIFY